MIKIPGICNAKPNMFQALQNQVKCNAEPNMFQACKTELCSTTVGQNMYVL